MGCKWKVVALERCKIACKRDIFCGKGWYHTIWGKGGSIHREPDMNSWPLGVSSGPFGIQEWFEKPFSPAKQKVVWFNTKSIEIILSHTKSILIILNHTESILVYLRPLRIPHVWYRSQLPCRPWGPRSLAKWSTTGVPTRGRGESTNWSWWFHWIPLDFIGFWLFMKSLWIWLYIP